MTDFKTLIRELTELNGNCGAEDNVIRYVVNYLRGKADIITVDSIGNVTAYFKSPIQNAKKLMLFAHMDEVGMVVRKIEDNGFLRLEKLGSVNPNILSGLRIEVLTQNGKIPGVLGLKPHHFLKPEDKQKIPTLENSYADIGAVSRADAESLGVYVGCPVSFKGGFMELANDMICNKSMDDRALVALLLTVGAEIEKEKLKSDLYLVFSVQEEFNTRGIMPAFRKIAPDVVIGFDVTPSCDTPELTSYSSISIGAGPALTYMNHHSRGTLAGLAPNIRFLEHIHNLADKLGISLQNEVATGILTETAYLTFDNSDTVVANISIPTRYTHTDIEVLSLSDLQSCFELVRNFIDSFDGKTDFSKKYLNGQEG